MSNLEKVREALELYSSSATWGKDDWGVLSVNVREYGMAGREAHAALAALSAHEAEVRELVEAIRDYIDTVELVDPGVYDRTRLNVAIRPIEDKR